MSNVKNVDLARHAWDTPPFLLIVSPTPPVQSVAAYVRTYARSTTWQPNEKRLTIIYEYGALSHARFARAGAPLKQTNPKQMALLTSDGKPLSLLQSAGLFSYVLISWARAEDARGRFVPEKKSSSFLSSGVSHEGPSKKGQTKWQNSQRETWYKFTRELINQNKTHRVRYLSLPGFPAFPPFPPSFPLSPCSALWDRRLQ